MKKIRVAIIGAGLIGKKRAEAIKKISEYSLVYIYDINKKAADDFSKLYDCQVVKNLNDILNDKTIDLVIIAIRHKDAAILTPRVLEKKNVLLEKPLGRNFIEAQKIIDTAKKYNRMLSVGFSFRCYPHIRLAKKYLENKKLGKIISSTFKIGHAAFPGYEKTWKMDKDLCGGGVILDPGIHMIDLMFTLIGKPQKQHVYMSSKGWNSKVEDEAFMIFEYANKSISSHHYSLNFSKNTFFIEIIGTKGTLRLEGRAGNYGDMTFSFTPKWFWLNKKETIMKNFGDNDTSFYEELKELATKINKRNQSNDYASYLDSMKILDTLYKQD